MPPKISKVGSSRSTKTIARASTSSSSKSSGSSKTSSSSGVKKSAPPAPAPKPRNVDKVDFGKTRTIADAGVYHRPKPIAAATGRDPEPSKPKSKNEDYDPMILTPDQRQKVREIMHEEAVKDSQNKAAQTAVRAAASEVAGHYGGAPARVGVATASATPIGQKIVEKVVEIVDESLRIIGENYTFEDMP